jgi:hypothetical protein
MAEEVKKLAKASYSFIKTLDGMTDWSPEEIDKLEITDLAQFDSIVKDCRFYYRRDPIASTVVNKMVEIGITTIIFDKGKLSDNEFRIFTGLKDKLNEFMELCALEYLLSGLVVPEVKYTQAKKEDLMDLGIKKYETLTVPVSMWLRDPTTIKIEDTILSDEPSYFVVLPDNMVFFIQNKGVYPDGNKDPDLYNKLITYYPEFVAQVLAGNKEVLLENDKIVRRKVITGSPYPTPYLYPALEALRHKRNIRRMDYSIASRAIEAIQLIQLGNDLYPVVEGEEGVFDDIREQMSYRNTSGKNMERIFQLFANHTLQINWIYPDMSALLNERKYMEVNQDIFFGLGFPRILTTGETERTQTSNSEFATLSPEKSMINMQNQMLKILKKITKEISIYNGFKDIPKVRFDKINLHSMADFISMMNAMRQANTISDSSYADAFGYNYEEEMRKKKEDISLQVSLGVDKATMIENETPEFQKNPPKSTTELAPKSPTKSTQSK